MKTYTTIFALEEGNEESFRKLDDICFNISVKDSTFSYRATTFKNKNSSDKLVITIFSDDKDVAYKRGLLIKKYFEKETGKDIFFKVKNIGDD